MKATSKIKTYSEHNDEAPFHTDAQYRLQPENFFGLFTLRKANCGGGTSGLITYASIIKLLQNHPFGREIEILLRNKDLPFAVPTVFSLSPQRNKKEAIFARILYGQNKIRYRFDTLMKGLEFYPSIVTPQEMELLRIFDKMINRSTDKIEFMLENGDILFVNNEQVLHRRSSFCDLQRHLLRVRFNRRINEFPSDPNQKKPVVSETLSLQNGKLDRQGAT